MATDIRTLFPKHRPVSELVAMLLDEKFLAEDRVDAAIYLMRADRRVAEDHMTMLLRTSSDDSFDFSSDLIDVLFSDWANRGESERAEALLQSLPGKLNRYGKEAWRRSFNPSQPA